MGKILEFKPRQKPEPPAPQEAESPLEAAWKAVKASYTEKELEEMFKELDEGPEGTAV